MFDIFYLIREARKYVKKSDLALSFGIIAVFFATRLVSLASFPIFNDEGIYIRWTKVAWHDATWRFISLTDGRQPLQTWLTIPFMKLFPNDALVAGRLFAVASGMVGLVGIFVLVSHIFNKKTAYVAAFLYVITPYFIFFNRFAMIDSLVAASYIWILFFSILLVKTLRLDVSLLFGLVSGLFLLAKSSTSMFLELSILAPILTFQGTVKKNLPRIINYVFLYGIAVVITVALYNIQRLSPFMHYVNEKNHTFILTTAELLADPFMVFVHNFKTIPYYVAHNVGYIIFVLGIIGLILLIKNNRRLGLYISTWIFLPYIAMCFFMRVLFARYVIFLMVPFVILSSYFINYILSQRFKLKKAVLTVIAISFVFVGYFNYTILFDPVRIPFVDTDRGMYLEGWPAGWGIKETVEFAREKSQEKPVILLAEGNFGMTGDVMDTYLTPQDTNISIEGKWPLGEEELRSFQSKLSTHYVFAVFAHQTEIPSNWPVKVIKRFDKPGNTSWIFLTELLK